jgi:ubiquinone/menaquinone biosynthesis C-methylase UbiE
MPRPAPTVPAKHPLTRFSDRVQTYAAHRPSYPAPAIDAVFEGIGSPTTLIVADVGAGTGISSRLLADRGCRVHAVEPNQEMRERGMADGHPRITWHDAAGEHTGLPDASVNIVACFQAFHWLDAAQALAEFARILTPRGRAALVWNVRDDADPFTRAYTDVILRHATDPPRSPHLGGGGHVPPEFREGWIDYHIARLPNAQTLDRESLIGRALSASYCPNTGDAKAALERDLRAVFDRWSSDGLVTLRYQCEMHRAESPA